MVTTYVKEMMETCRTMIGHFIIALQLQQRLQSVALTHQIVRTGEKKLETVTSHLK